MRAPEWIQFAALTVLLIVSTPIIGAYMAKVYANGRAPGDRVFGPIERLIYRICGIDRNGEQRWKSYTTLAAVVQRRRGARRLLRAAHAVAPAGQPDARHGRSSRSWRSTRR